MLNSNNTEHGKIRLRHHCRFKAVAGIRKTPIRDKTWTRPLREQIAASHIDTQNTASYPGVNLVLSLDLEDTNLKLGLVSPADVDSASGGLRSGSGQC